MSFAERLDELVQRVSSGNKAAFARHVGVDPKSISDYLKGTSPTLDKLTAIATRCGVSLDWLALDHKTDNYKSPQPIWLEISRLSFKASGGRGSLVLDGEDGTFAILRTVLERIGVKQENARALTAQGTSMRPIIDDGDTMILDISLTEFAEGPVFAFTVGDEAYVKRLRRVPGRIMMVSDNPDFPPEPIPREEAFRIIGQVKWAERLL